MLTELPDAPTTKKSRNSHCGMVRITVSYPEKMQLSNCIYTESATVLSHGEALSQCITQSKTLSSCKNRRCRGTVLVVMEATVREDTHTGRSTHGGGEVKTSSYQFFLSDSAYFVERVKREIQLL